MVIRVSELYEKEVICVKDGVRLGSIGDVDVNTQTGHIEAIVIAGHSRLFGLFGRSEEQIIPIGCVELFGDEVILVNYTPPEPRKRQGKFLLTKWFE